MQYLPQLPSFSRNTDSNLQTSALAMYLKKIPAGNTDLKKRGKKIKITSQA